MFSSSNSEILFAAILDSVADGVTAQNKVGKLIYANATAARLIGYPSVESLLAASVGEVVQQFELFDENKNPFPLAQMPGRLALAGIETQPITLCFRVKATGEERYSIVQSKPVRDANGAVEYVVNTFQDITKQRLHEIALAQESAAAQIKQQFMTAASKEINSSLDYEATLTSITRMCTPAIADWASVDLLTDDEDFRRVAVSHTDPEKIKWAYELQKRYPVDPDATRGYPVDPNETRGYPQVVRTGISEYIPKITDEFLVLAARDAEQLQIIRDIGFRSAIIVPLTARGRHFGAITLITTNDSGRFFTQQDVEDAEELGRIGGLAIENARLYRETVLQRERFQVTLTSIGDAVIATDAKGLVTFMNPVAERVTGWNLSEATGHHLDTVFKIVNEDTRVEVESPVDKVIREGVIVGLANHTVLLTKDGREVPIDDSGAPIWDENHKLNGVVLIFRDITERKHAEEALKESSEQYSSIVNSAMDAIISIDQNQIIILFNSAAEKMFGCTVKDAVGKSIDQFIPQRFREAHVKHVDLFGRTGTTSRSMVSRDSLMGLRKNGEEFPIEATIAHAKIRNQQLYTVILRDVSERERLFAAERAARLQAEEANALKLRFLGMISHELRTPLTSIKGFASVLLTKDLSIEQVAQKQYAAIIDEEADRLTGLVDQLLNLSHIQSGMLSIDVIPQSIHDVFNHVQPQLQLITANHELTFDIPDDLPSVLIDGERISQVLTNLVSNAVKYSTMGTPIQIVVRRENGYVQINITDRGEGIAPENRTLVFEAFRQLNRNRKRSTQGAGLGLAICKGIIEAHKGKIWIQDLPPPGTTISFTLPTQF